jgi:hypothetical protein
LAYVFVYELAFSPFVPGQMQGGEQPLHAAASPRSTSAASSAAAANAASCRRIRQCNAKETITWLIPRLHFHPMEQIVDQSEQSHTTKVNIVI